MLTERQKQVLEAIQYFIEQNGYSPSYREIAELLNMKHVNSVFNMVMRLEKKGYVSTEIGKKRTIHIIKR